MINDYYQLTKPGIIYGNVITTAAGFFLASKGQIDWLMLLETIIAMSFVIGGSCVINNYMDRDIDVHMARTKNRALVTGKISNTNAIIFAVILGLIGSLAFFFFTNLLTLTVALIGSLVYLALYTPMKRRSVFGTVIGGIAGAVPPVVGYVAVTNNIDAGAIILFLILMCWQLPHFYSISIYRHDDYAAARIPVMSVEKGIIATKINILLYIIVFSIAAVSLTIFEYTGLIYLVVVGTAVLLWLGYAIKGFMRNNNDRLWARKMFFTSLVMLFVVSIMMSVNPIIN